MYQPSKPYKQKILHEIKHTWRTPYASVSLNTYPLLRKHFSYPEIDHTDGIGTKGLYHWRQGTLRAAVIDALAMNLNDLAVVRATPYKLSNHITVPVEDGRLMTIIRELVRQCRKYRIAIVGGENSFHNNINGLDISMTVSGFVKKPMPNRFRVGDALVGLKSSGLHSNGFTLVRRLFGNTVKPEFTVPTKIYLPTVLALLTKYEIHGMAHITGGAFTKLKDILSHSDAYIEHARGLRPQKIFYDIYRKGISSKEMYTTFNCGIGFILSVGAQEAKKIARNIDGVEIIGKVAPGKGRVHIRSAFDGKWLKL